MPTLTNRPASHPMPAPQDGNNDVDRLALDVVDRMRERGVRLTADDIAVVAMALDCPQADLRVEGHHAANGPGCQPWCESRTCVHNTDCSTDILTVAATGRDATPESSTSGVNFPGASVRGGISDTAEKAAVVCLHLGDMVDMDAEVFLRPHEAQDLIANIQRVLGEVAG